MNILVALSGGVDSSVAAFLLKEQGHNVFAATLKTFCYTAVAGGPKSCCGLDGIESARAVAATLGIPHTVFDVSERFESEVIADFVREYAAGRTPNPCVLCNATVKIPDLLEKAARLGCEAVATGHYAQLTDHADGRRLSRGLDSGKDQSYFLWGLPQNILPHVWFPIGQMAKPQVRRIAAELGLASAEKPESQEICFVPDGEYAAFCQGRLPPDHPGLKPGIIRDTHGQSVGTHPGYLHFTVGQRKGLGGGHGRRLFVVEIDAARREVIVGTGDEAFSTRLRVGSLNVLADPELFVPEGLLVQIRHRATAVPVRLLSRQTEEWEFELSEPARAVTPGQSAVFYRENRVLGGGRITSSRRSDEPAVRISPTD